MFKSADAATRNRIETAVLEHAFEAPKLRAFFVAWAADPLLSPAYREALAWGEAHGAVSGNQLRSDQDL